MHNYLFLVIGDVLISALAVYTGFKLRFGVGERFGEEYVANLVIFIIVTVCISYLMEQYNIVKKYKNPEIFLRTLLVLVGSSIILSAVHYMLNITMVYRGMFLASLIVFGLFQFLWHSGYRWIIYSSHLARKVLVLGVGDLAKRIGDLIQSTNHQHMLCGYLNMTNEPILVPAEEILSNGDGIYNAVKASKADKVVISLSERRGTFPLEDVLNCKFRGIEVLDAPSFYEELTGKLLIENTNPSWFIFCSGFRLDSTIRFYKRTLDVICALIGIGLTLPLLPLIILLIKVESRGPLFFRQVRVGELDKNFILYKFRTMQENAEQVTGAVWAQKNDPRITRIGKFFRSTRIDELPQLYNVLKGDMSFIGPRPERPQFVEKLKQIIPYYSQRHFVKPGITGWAQIRYPYGASVEDALEKLRYDLYYIKNMSFFLELTIIIETAKVMLFGRGAR